MKKPFFLFFILFSAAIEDRIALSKDLGVFGETFDIAEKDLLEQISLNLRKMEESGELTKRTLESQERVKDMILHPKAIDKITHTQKMREYKFDPTITVTRDLSDHRGQIFARKGERLNPLDKITFSKPLLFIDGEDEKQISWAVSKIKRNSLGKVILVRGSPLDLQKQLKRDIFFDQQGLLTEKLGIEHVPAIVFQKSDEKVLTISEETVDGEGQ